MRLFVQIAVGLTVCLSMSIAAAQNKVVVIPLNSSKFVPGGVYTVTSAGQVWMDRNLGALRVATKRADPDSYGTLYQWGRLGDGHEYRSSSTTPNQSSTDVPGHGSFIIEHGDWRTSPNADLWQGESGINNPCPAGFRLPTEAEWVTEIDTWATKNSAGALASPLKLVPAGFRDGSFGTLYDAGSDGFYWSSTVDGSYSRLIYFGSGTANMTYYLRAYGFSVRCIKD